DQLHHLSGVPHHEPQRPAVQLACRLRLRCQWHLRKTPARGL
ncbi:hypothetical protein, partial [Pseudomonas sp. FG-3G]